MFGSSLPQVSKEIIHCPGYDVKLLKIKRFWFYESEGQIERGIYS